MQSRQIGTLGVPKVPQNVFVTTQRDTRYLAQVKEERLHSVFGGNPQIKSNQPTWNSQTEPEDLED